MRRSSPPPQDLRNLEYLGYLFDLRFGQRLLGLATSLQRQLGAGQPLFDVWMKQESDAIQATAKAYAEHGTTCPPLALLPHPPAISLSLSCPLSLPPSRVR